jgi:hypothetical protein
MEPPLDTPSLDKPFPGRYVSIKFMTTCYQIWGRTVCPCFQNFGTFLLLQNIPNAVYAKFVGFNDDFTITIYICLNKHLQYNRGDNLRRPDAIPKGVGGTDWPIRIRRLPSPPPSHIPLTWHSGTEVSPQLAGWKISVANRLKNFAAKSAYQLDKIFFLLNIFYRVNCHILHVQYTQKK